jgi:hypothetical protein
MPTTLPTTMHDVAQALRDVLTSVADAAAVETRFVKRRSKRTGAAFVQTLTFGWLAKPEATLEELAQTAAAVGVPISGQGLDQRFTSEGAACLRTVLEAAVTRVLTADPVAIPILQRFPGGVSLLDSTTVPLPDALAPLWPGCGRNDGPDQAAIKLQVRLDLLHGKLTGPVLLAGRANDHHGELAEAPLPKGALHLADLGFFDLDRLRTLSKQDVYWLTRVQVNTRLYDAFGQLCQLPELLAQHKANAVDLRVQLGKHHRLPCRLLAVRVPAAVAAQRRERMLKKARRLNKKIDPGRWALAEWTVYATNAPESLMSLEDGLVLARCRWQIELLFKLWKSEGRIDESRSTKPWRILCEVYGKLLGMVVQHWILLVTCWNHANRSWVKASRTVRSHALHLAIVLRDGQFVCRILEIIRRCLKTGGRINKRRKEPNTYQLLLNLGETDNVG